jgi:hypothetical protein
MTFFYLPAQHSCAIVPESVIHYPIRETGRSAWVNGVRSILEAPL